MSLDEELAILCVILQLKLANYCKYFNPFFMTWDKFSEVVMNASSEIAWRIFRANPCLFIKKRGELQKGPYQGSYEEGSCYLQVQKSEKLLRNGP